MECTGLGRAVLVAALERLPCSAEQLHDSNCNEKASMSKETRSCCHHRGCSVGSSKHLMAPDGALYDCVQRVGLGSVHRHIAKALTRGIQAPACQFFLRRTHRKVEADKTAQGELHFPYSASAIPSPK